MNPTLKAAKRSGAGKPSPQSDREFLEALIWEARTGSPWRDMPTEFGHWHNVYMRFRRWEQAGVWQRFWAGLQQEALEEAKALFVDSTTVRAHQHAAGAPKKTLMMRHWAAREAD
jgi:transposase